MTFWQRLQAWLRFGVDSEQRLALRRKIFHANLGGAIGFSTVLLYAMVYIASGNPDLIHIAIAEFPFYFLFAAVLWLNKRGKQFLAAWLLVLASMGSVIVAIQTGMGTHLGMHVYLLLFAVMPVIIFVRSQWPSVVLLFVVNLTIYFYYQTVPVESVPILREIDEEWGDAISIMIIISVMLTMLFLLWLADSVGERSEIRIEQMAMTDNLTGLPNRRMFGIFFQNEQGKSARSGESTSIVMLDIDHFKQVNDTHGHPIGDLALKHIARVMGEVSRTGNLLARIGGEEFAVLLPGTTMAQAAEMAERLRSTVESSNCPCGPVQLKITISAGVAPVEPGMTLDVALRNADIALYSAKRSGRNRVMLYREMQSNIVPT